jgi:two-component system LytT family sensor kinase
MPPRAKISWPHSFAIWTGIGLVLLMQTFATVEMPAMSPEQDRVNFWSTVFFQISRAWLWCLFTPVVFELRRRIPMCRWWLPVGIVTHVAFAWCITAWIFGVRGWILAPFVLEGAQLEWTYTINYILDGMGTRQLIDAMLYLGLIGVGYTLDLAEEKKHSDLRERELRVQLTKKELQEEQLRSELVQAEMKALKQQLHPHFLFNALNAVSGLVRQGQNERAVTALSQVSALLRALIGSTGRPEVTLEDEINYCETYLAIEKMRFDSRLHYSFDIAPPALVAEVPALLLQPMVENAIKHGIARRRNPGEVRVSARLDGETLHLEVMNDAAEMAKGQSAPESHGVGLDTTRQRLERAFGKAFQLDFEIGATRTVVTLRLPFRVAEAAVPVRAAVNA